MSAYIAFLALFIAFFGLFFFTLLGVYLWSSAAPKKETEEASTIAARRPAPTPGNIAGVQ